MTDAKVNIDRELELIDGMIEVQLHHAKQCDGIANRTMAEKQKAWDMERVALLRKMRAALAAQPADAQFEDDLIESVGQMQRGEVARVWQPAEPVAWLWRLNHSGKAFFMVADSTLREVLTDAFPVYAAPPAPAAVPLTDAQIERLREATFSTNNPFCPVDSKSMRKAIRAAERAHGIAAAGDKP